jgi:HSP90 family molecular chaperone
LGGENKDKIMASPVMQALKEKELEVLLFDDPIDEYAF